MRNSRKINKDKTFSRRNISGRIDICNSDTTPKIGQTVSSFCCLWCYVYDNESTKYRRSFKSVPTAVKDNLTVSNELLFTTGHCRSATLSTTNPTWPDLGSNSGRRSGKPATNRLSYGTACLPTYLNGCIRGMPTRAPAPLWCSPPAVLHFQWNVVSSRGVLVVTWFHKVIYLDQVLQCVFLRAERKGLAHGPLSFAYNWFHLFSQAGHVGDLIYLSLTAQYSKTQLRNKSHWPHGIKRQFSPSSGVFQ
jgi:hypothetical protein